MAAMGPDNTDRAVDFSDVGAQFVVKGEDNSEAAAVLNASDIPDIGAEFIVKRESLSFDTLSISGGDDDHKVTCVIFLDPDVIDLSLGDDD